MDLISRPGVTITVVQLSSAQLSSLTSYSMFAALLAERTNNERTEG